MDIGIHSRILHISNYSVHRFSYDCFVYVILNYSIIVYLTDMDTNMRIKAISCLLVHVVCNIYGFTHQNLKVKVCIP